MSEHLTTVLERPDGRPGASGPMAARAVALCEGCPMQMFCQTRGSGDCPPERSGYDGGAADNPPKLSYLDELADDSIGTVIAQLAPKQKPPVKKPTKAVIKKPDTKKPPKKDKIKPTPQSHESFLGLAADVVLAMFGISSINAALTKK